MNRDVHRLSQCTSLFLLGEFLKLVQVGLNLICVFARPFDSAQGEWPHPRMDSGSGGGMTDKRGHLHADRLPSRDLCVTAGCIVCTIQITQPPPPLILREPQHERPQALQHWLRKGPIGGEGIGHRLSPFPSGLYKGHASAHAQGALAASATHRGRGDWPLPPPRGIGGS